MTIGVIGLHVFRGWKMVRLRSPCTVLKVKI
jgi:hypothetical protein